MKRLSLSFVAFWLLLTPALAGETGVELTLDDATLHGTLLAADNARAMAIIIAGSGPTDRDGNSALLPGANNSLKLVAETLADNRVSSIRYDKRMIGESRIPGLAETHLRFDHYVADAAAWAAFAAEQYGLPVYLVGHSEGAQIAMVAAAHNKYAGVILLAGPGQHPADLIESQLAAQLPAPMMQQARETLAALRNGQTVDNPPPMLASLFRASVQPYIISWFQYDPATTMAQVEEPALLVYGTTDIQVPVSDASLLTTANTKAEVVIIEGMNHVLKAVSADRGAQQSSYSDPSLPLHPDLVEALVGYIADIDR
ncbi:MAG: alpha/beta hydrolase [Pseudomonadota bacterium]